MSFLNSINSRTPTGLGLGSFLLLALFATGCSSYALEKEARKVASERGVCAALDHVHGEVPSADHLYNYWTLWGELATECLTGPDTSQYYFDLVTETFSQNIYVTDSVLDAADASLQLLKPVVLQGRPVVGVKPVPGIDILSVNGEKFLSSPSDETMGVIEWPLKSDTDDGTAIFDVRYRLFGRARTHRIEQPPLAMLNYAATRVVPCMILDLKGPNGELLCELSVTTATASDITIRHDAVTKWQCDNGTKCTIQIPARYAYSPLTAEVKRPGYTSSTETLQVELRRDYSYVVGPSVYNKWHCDALCQNAHKLAYSDIPRGAIIKLTGYVNDLTVHEGNNIITFSTDGTQVALVTPEEGFVRYGARINQKLTVYGMTDDHISYDTSTGSERTVPRILLMAVQTDRDAVRELFGQEY